MNRKIFFTAAVRGGRTHAQDYTSIVEILAQYGTVLEEQVSNTDLSTYGETQFSSKEIFERELRNLNASDVVVAEVTTPSLGVGYFIAYATSLGKRVIALYHGEDTLKLSGIIKGDTLVDVRPYTDEKDINRILKEKLSE